MDTVISVTRDNVVISHEGRQINAGRPEDVMINWPHLAAEIQTQLAALPAEEPLDVSF